MQDIPTLLPSATELSKVNEVSCLETLDLNNMEFTPLLTQCAGLTATQALVYTVDEDLDLCIHSVLDEDKENYTGDYDDDELAEDDHLLRTCASLPMSKPMLKAAYNEYLPINDNILSLHSPDLTL